MVDRDDVHGHSTYVVRVSRDDTGSIRGVVVRVATGERLPFAGVNDAGPLLQKLIEADLSPSCSRGSDVRS
jgi:hypothetical protein